jgi:hypothetical protein
MFARDIEDQYMQEQRHGLFCIGSDQRLSLVAKDIEDRSCSIPSPSWAQIYSMTGTYCMGHCRSKCEIYEPDRSRPTSSTALKQVPEQGSYDSDGGPSSFDLVLQSIVD